MKTFRDILFSYVAVGVLNPVEGRKNDASAKESRPNEILFRVTGDIEFGG